jgi:hypothetical protein
METKQLIAQLLVAVAKVSWEFMTKLLIFIA